MQFKSIIAALAATTAVVAQNSTSNSTTTMSICDKYTTALLMNNTAENQLMLLTLLVNTVVIGNYVNTSKNDVPGILANGTVNGTQVNLLPYFNGGLASSNRGGKAVAVNFLDDGGAAPLKMNKPANGTNSNQYRLLTHLYQFFGTLLQCSQQGMSGYPAYSGIASMGSVHQFMYLTYAETTYFIQQVALAAQSFGVEDADVQAVGMALNGLFNVRCGAAPTDGPLKGATQSICIAPDCPLAPANNCSAYINAVKPGVADPALAMGEGDTANTATASAPNGGNPTATVATTSSTGAAGARVIGGGAAAGLGLLAFFL